MPLHAIPYESPHLLTSHYSTAPSTNRLPHLQTFHRLIRELQIEGTTSHSPTNEPCDFLCLLMVPGAESQKAHVTEIHVRMDCNGCVHRMKKAISSIDGVYSVCINFSQQKLTVVGHADPEKIVRAIKKTRRIATICSHTEPGGSEPPATEQPASSDPPAPDAANQPPTEPAAPPTEPPKDDAPPPDNPEPEVKASTETKDAAPAEPTEVHMVHQYPHSYVYREHWNHSYAPTGHEMHLETPFYVTHSYNSYQPSTSVSGYVYLRSPPRDIGYSDGYYHNRGYRYGNQVTSMFSDEDPNACRIV